MGRDSSVGIATRYGLDGPGIESRCARVFQYPLRPVLGTTLPLVQWVPGLSIGVKRSGRGADPHPHLQCRGLKQGRAIPLPTLRALVACRGRTFTFTFCHKFVTIGGSPRTLLEQILKTGLITYHGNLISLCFGLLLYQIMRIVIYFLNQLSCLF